jgi:hypothetical protein
MTNTTCFNLTRALDTNSLEWDNVLDNKKENNNTYTQGTFDNKTFPYIPEEAFKISYTELNIELKEVNKNNNITLEWKIEGFLSN